MGKLTAISAKNAKAGRHADGQGLYLLVKDSGARSWMLRVQVDKRRRDVGLGSFSDLTLAEARDKSADLRKAARRGADPVLERDRDRRPAPTFKVAALACHEEMKRGWVDKHAAAWLTSLKDHAFPALGTIRVDHIETSTIRDMLAPIWTDIPVTARNVRQRVGTVLNYAKSKGWRTAEAPGKSVTMGLARHVKGGNFSAMPYAEVPAIVRKLRGETPTVGRLSLLFSILTAARSGEVRSAKWSHIDLASGTWTRPAGLMKSRVEHAVTLSPEALGILEQVAAYRTTKADCLVFPGKGGKQQSDMTLTKVLRDAGGTSTVHGFRSSFRDWAAELMPTIPGEVAEAALAHAVANATERAYRRTAFLDMRRKLMDAWGSYTLGRDNVLRLAAG